MSTKREILVRLDITGAGKFMCASCPLVMEVHDMCPYSDTRTRYTKRVRDCIADEMLAKEARS